MNLGMPCIQVGEHPTCDLKELGEDTPPIWPCQHSPQHTLRSVLDTSGQQGICHGPCAWLQHPRGFLSLEVQVREMSFPAWEGPNSACLTQTPKHQHQDVETPQGSRCHLLLCCPIPGHAGCLNLWGFALSVFSCHFSGLFPGRAAGAGCRRSAGEEAGSSSFPSI